MEQVTEDMKLIWSFLENAFAYSMEYANSGLIAGNLVKAIFILLVVGMVGIISSESRPKPRHPGRKYKSVRVIQKG